MNTLQKNLFGQCNSAQFNEPGPEKEASSLCRALTQTFDRSTHSVLESQSLPVADIQKCAENVIHVLENITTLQWLAAVRTHGSFTYRHIMIVTGFAAKFGLMYGMSQKDKNRLTLGALLHDIGKTKMPLRILDKPGKLTKDELAIMRQHPQKGYNILSKHPELGQEAMLVARSHHEFLDGTGYPDRLTGPEIPDIVRIVTIVDIFSALIEARPYKKSLSPDQAYLMLRDMGGKLDQDIVRAFKPIALNHPVNGLFTPVNGAAA